MRVNMAMYYSLMEFETHARSGNDKRYDQKIPPIWDAQNPDTYIDKRQVEQHRIPADKYVNEHMLPLP